MRHFRLAISAALIALLSAPAFADVKDGIAAWERGDYAEAVAEWRGPAERGDADAEFNLGQAYKLGRGVPADLERAEAWYRKAALQGHRQAEDNYGLALFQNGKRDDALPWLEKSAARGEPRAEFVLGTVYFNGKAVDKDWVRAYALMTRASQAGLPKASTTLTRMNRYITPADRQAGLKLAREFQAGTAPTEIAAVSPNPATTASPGYGKQAEPTSKPTPAPKPLAPQPTAPPPSSQPKPEPAVRDGGWRVQLGAFSHPGNARSLWAAIDDKVAMFKGRKPFYEKAGGLTRLKVGPFASGAQARRACAQVKARGKACLPVGP